MKKILLGTTGLIGAALLSAAANAETPKVTLGGFADFQAGYTSDDSDNNQRGSAFRNDNEVHVRVDGKTDGGLGYGAVIELEADTSADVNGEGTNAARTFTYLQGNWGRFELGSVEGAAQAMRVDASSIAVATGGIDGAWTYFVNTNAPAGGGALAASGGFITTPALPTEHGSLTALNDENFYNINKINYYSPKFSGFQIGASYAPDAGSKGQTINKTERLGAAVAPTNADYGDVLNLGLSFDHQFDNAWSFAAAITGEWAEADSVTAPVAKSNDIQAWNVGAKLGYLGFAVAASYGDWDDSADAVAAPSLESDYWTLGAAYETGPFGVSATYLNSEVETGAATTNEFDNIVLGADYKLAPGLTPYAEVSFYEFDQGGAGGYDNDGTTFLIGTQVAF